MGKFEDLRVWKRSKDLAVFIYKLTDHDKFMKDFGLRDQIRRAAVSVPSNIAEGDDLDTDKQAIRFFYIAKGSAADSLHARLPQEIVASQLRGTGSGQRLVCWFANYGYG